MYDLCVLHICLQIIGLCSVLGYITFVELVALYIDEAPQLAVNVNTTSAQPKGM